MSEHVVQQPFDAGTILPLNGFPADRVVAVGTGTIRIEWPLGDGRRQILGFYFRGDVLVSPMTIANARASAIKRGVLYHIDATKFEACRDYRGGRQDHKQIDLQEDLAGMAHQILMLGQFTAREKLATFLIDLADRIGRQSPDGIDIEIAMNRKDIADFLGLNAETVSRTFSRLKADRLISLPKPDRAVIFDRSELEQLIPEHTRPLFEQQPNVA